jgi:hypothetical protein
LKLLVSGIYLLITFLCWNSIHAHGQTSRRVHHNEGKTVNYQGKLVNCKVTRDLLIYQGDIVLGQVSHNKNEEEISARPTKLWPDGIIPYEIDPALPNPQRVLESIRHWNENTTIKLVERDQQDSWVRFVQFNNPERAGFSQIGMAGGVQDILLDDSNGPSIIIHEIGHTVGLWHEQSRFDRDDYIRINTRNIKPDFVGQFTINSFDSQDVGPYDFGSIMHYGISTFSTNGLTTIDTIPEGIPIGEQGGLSELDIDGVRRLYGNLTSTTIITTFPAGLNIEVDGVTYTSPQKFFWSPGSKHEISVIEKQGTGFLTFNFARWSNNGSRTQIVTASNDGGAYAASFARRVMINFQASPAEGGTVTVVNPSTDGKYPQGTFVKLLATPNPGYYFSHWEGLPVGILQGISSNPATFLSFTSRTPFRAHFTTTPMTTIRANLPELPIQIDGRDYLDRTVLAGRQDRFIGWKLLRFSYRKEKPMSVISFKAGVMAAAEFRQ